MPTLRADKVVFTGLKPGTAFDYKVPGREELSGSFKTPPAGDQPFEFVVYGDNRTRHDVHKKVIAGACWPTATRTSWCKPATWWPTARTPRCGPFSSISNGNCCARWPSSPRLGNHERNATDYYDFFQAAPYYSFDWGKAHFAIFNSDIANAGPNEAARQAFWKEQTAWLEEDLRKSQGATFRFVVAHHPPMTAVTSRQGDNPHITALVPMFEKYHVTAALFGHDHNYQHYLKNGVHYIVAGGGGAPLYDVDKPPRASR